MSEQKIAKIGPAMKVGTHDGKFHCDEVLACGLLEFLHKNVSVVRSRDPAVLATCDIVVDVGGVYDHAAQRYDHHQAGFGHSMSSLAESGFANKTKLSSAGLVYLHYGKEVLKTLQPQLSENEAKVLYKKVYDNFIEEIDAIDNGIDHCASPAYQITTNLSSRVGNLNPAWNEDADDATVEKRFSTAVDSVRSEFVDRVEYYAKAWLPARNIVEETVKNRFDVHSSGEIMVLPKSAPWVEHFFDILEEKAAGGDAEGLDQVKYVLFAEAKGDSWRIQCIPVARKSFVNRKSLPWRGLREAELCEATGGVGGCVFVHANGFIGGNKTYEGALAMAVKAVAM